MRRTLRRMLESLHRGKIVRTLNIKIETAVQDGNYFAAIRPQNPLAHIVESGRTPAKARAALRAAIMGALERDALNQRNGSMRVIACNNGHVIIVRFNPQTSQFEYRIASHDRLGMCSTFGDGMNKFQTALEAARKHATDSFGGIAWENY